MNLFYVVGGFLLLVLAIWLVGFFFSNDFSVPSVNIKSYKNVLIIFPHPDDEVLTVGGFLGLLNDNHIKSTLLILTKGEKGNANGSYDETLKDVREKEYVKASSLLGVSQSIIKDLGDGALDTKKSELSETISKVISEVKPDLVITYDLTGLYGHPDHIVTSEVVTKLIKTKYSQTKLWYVEYPKQIMEMINWPEKMAKDPAFKSKRVFPDKKIWIGKYIFNKIRAVYIYNSQYQSFKSALPNVPLPMAFFHSLTLFEYFYEVKN